MVGRRFAEAGFVQQLGVRPGYRGRGLAHPDPRHTVTFQYNGDCNPIRGFFFTNGYRPADPSPLFQDGRTTITITSPQANETVGATLTVHVAAPNCSGVELDAYYATDPSDINSVH